MVNWKQLTAKPELIDSYTIQTRAYRGVCCITLAVVWGTTTGGIRLQVPGQARPNHHQLTQDQARDAEVQEESAEGLAVLSLVIIMHISPHVTVCYFVTVSTVVRTLTHIDVIEIVFLSELVPLALQFYPPSIYQNFVFSSLGRVFCTHPPYKILCFVQIVSTGRVLYIHFVPTLRTKN